MEGQVGWMSVWQETAVFQLSCEPIAPLWAARCGRAKLCICNLLKSYLSCKWCTVCAVIAAGSKAFIAKAHNDGVLLEFWAQGRMVKVRCFHN
jgi:hypothetical protein